MSNKGVENEFLALRSIGYDANAILANVQNATAQNETDLLGYLQLETIVAALQANKINDPSSLAKIINELIDFSKKLKVHVNILPENEKNDLNGELISIVRSCAKKIIDMNNNNKNLLTDMNDESLENFFNELFILLPRWKNFDRELPKDSYSNIMEIYINVLSAKGERSVQTSLEDESYYSEAVLDQYEHTLETENEFTQSFDSINRESIDNPDKKSAQLMNPVLLATTLLGRIKDGTINHDEINKELVALTSTWESITKREDVAEFYKKLIQINSEIEIIISRLAKDTNSDKKIIESYTSIFLDVKNLYEDISKKMKNESKTQSNTTKSHSDKSQTYKAKSQIDEYNADTALYQMKKEISIKKTAVSVLYKALGLDNIENSLLSNKLSYSNLNTLSVKLLELQNELIKYRGTLTLKEKLRLNKSLDEIQSHLEMLSKNCTGQVKSIEIIKEGVERFNTHDFKNILNSEPKYNPNNKTPHDLSIARKIAKEIGVHGRLAMLKRKIYTAQIRGSTQRVDKFKTKVESYLTHLNNELVATKDENLQGILKAEIKYAENLVKECSKNITPFLKAQRVNRLFVRNPKRKMSEKVAESVKELHQRNKKLYEKDEAITQVNNPDEILRIFESKMQDLSTKHFKLYSDYSYALYCKFKQDIGLKLNKNELMLINQLPKLAAKIIHLQNLTLSNISERELSSAKEKYTSPAGNDLQADPVYNLLSTVISEEISLSERSAVNIIRGSTSNDQNNIDMDIKRLIEANLKVNKINIDKYLEIYSKLPDQNDRNIFQQKRAKNIEKKVAKLLGLAELNQLLKSEVTLNTALSDKYGKLSDLKTMGENYSQALLTASRSLANDSPHNKSLVDILSKESKKSAIYAHRAVSAKQIMSQRQVTTVEEVPLSKAAKAARSIKQKEYPPKWAETSQESSKKEKDSGDKGSQPPPSPAG